MTEKSFVGLMACPICGKDSGILLDRRLRDTFENGKKYRDNQPCQTCQKVLDLGGLWLIEVKDGEQGENPYRTGYMAGMSKEFRERNNIKEQVCYIPESDLKKIMGDQYKAEFNALEGK